MSALIIIGAAVVIYLCRVSGFLLHERLAASSWDRRLSFVPIGVFSALIVTSVMGQPDLISAKVIALVIGSMVIARTRRMGLGIVVGLVAFWGLRVLTGGL
jgi:branched-subunit amino acid transport protein